MNLFNTRRVDINNIESILGFINKFIEHDEIKTIFISDEDKISNEKYNKIKEKLIGRTYEYEPDLSRIIDDIINSYKKYPEFKTFLLEQKDCIYKVVINSGSKNIRTLKKSINYFHPVFNILCEENNILNLVGEDLLNFTLSVIFELDLGRAQIKELELFFADKENYINFVVFEKEDKENSYIERYLDMYYDGWPKNQFISMSIFKFILSGYLDKESLKEELTNIVKPDRDPDQILIDKFSFWADLENSEFEKLSDEIIEKVHKGKIKSLTHILKLFEYYLFFIKEELVKITLLDLKKIFNEGLEKLALNGELNYTDNLENTLISYSESTGEEYQEFKKRVVEQNEKLCLKNIEEKSIGLLDLIPVNLEEFTDIICSHGTDGLGSIPIFNHIPIDILYSKIENLENNKLRILWHGIESRYKSVNIGQYLFEEFNNLELLRLKINDSIKDQKVTVKVVLLKKISNSLRKICDNLKQYTM